MLGSPIWTHDDTSWHDQRDAEEAEREGLFYLAYLDDAGEPQHYDASKPYYDLVDALTALAREQADSDRHLLLVRGFAARLVIEIPTEIPEPPKLDMAELNARLRAVLDELVSDRAAAIAEAEHKCPSCLEGLPLGVETCGRRFCVGDK